MLKGERTWSPRGPRTSPTPGASHPTRGPPPSGGFLSPSLSLFIWKMGTDRDAQKTQRGWGPDAWEMAFVCVREKPGIVTQAMPPAKGRAPGTCAGGRAGASRARGLRSESRRSTGLSSPSRGRPGEFRQAWSTHPGPGPISHLPAAPPESQALLPPGAAICHLPFCLGDWEACREGQHESRPTGPRTFFSGVFTVSFQNSP